MGCCGDLRAEMPWSIDTGPPPVIPKELQSTDLRIGYVGGNSFAVRGSYTGRRYTFSPDARVQMVDRQDSRVLLRTRYFKRV